MWQFFWRIVGCVYFTFIVFSCYCNWQSDEEIRAKLPLKPLVEVSSFEGAIKTLGANHNYDQYTTNIRDANSNAWKNLALGTILLTLPLISLSCTTSMGLRVGRALTIFRVFSLILFHSVSYGRFFQEQDCYQVEMEITKRLTHEAEDGAQIVWASESRAVEFSSSEGQELSEGSRVFLIVRKYRSEPIAVSLRPLPSMETRLLEHKIQKL